MAVFELGGALASALPELEVGPWTNARPGLLAFDADPGPPESLWRVELARDDAASRAALADGELSVARTHAALDDVPRRLDRALERALAELAHPGPARGDRRVAPAPALPRIEAGLVAALARAEGELQRRPELQPAWVVEAVGAVGATGAAGVPSFAAPGPGTLERALQRVGDLARGRARIETRVEGALVACSVTTLSGDTELRIASGLSIAGAKLHARSVAVAVRTRHAWARVLALIVSGGGRIIALGLPAASVSALPLVWRFVRDTLREIGERSAAPPIMA